MKKSSLLLVAALIMALIVSGCGKKEAKVEKITIRINSSFNDAAFKEHPAAMAIGRFIELMEEKLGDRVEIKLFPGGQLGGTPDDIIGGLQNGSFEMANLALGSYGEFTKAFMPFDIPYLFTNADVVYAFLDGEMGDKMAAALLEQTGVKLVAYLDIGFRQTTNSKRPITSPTDMKGLKIRTMTNPLQMAVMKQLGAAPTPLAYSELFTALQQGTVDGQENPILNIYDMKFYEVQKYMTITNHNYTSTSFVIAGKFFDELPDDVKETLLECASSAELYSREKLAEVEAEILKTISERIQITYLTDDQARAFNEQSKGAWSEAAEAIGQDYFTEIVAEVERIKSDLGL
ncbi:MAG: TRAP transporter substrate-binding protein [Clostridia bacterium]|nr:TRAP transporter substrate-binding protein [Clostridia bacterium]